MKVRKGNFDLSLPYIFTDQTSKNTKILIFQYSKTKPHSNTVVAMGLF